MLWSPFFLTKYFPVSIQPAGTTSPLLAVEAKKIISWTSRIFTIFLILQKMEVLRLSVYRPVFFLFFPSFTQNQDLKCCWRCCEMIQISTNGNPIYNSVKPDRRMVIVTLYLSYKSTYIIKRISSFIRILFVIIYSPFVWWIFFILSRELIFDFVVFIRIVITKSNVNPRSITRRHRALVCRHDGLHPLRLMKDVQTRAV